MRSACCAASACSRDSYCAESGLAAQDFAVEPDEQRMRKAAHLMVGSLAGSLALVTCRDPLRTSLTNRLRSLLAQGLDAAALEQYVQVITCTPAFTHRSFLDLVGTCPLPWSIAFWVMCSTVTRHQSPHW